MNSKIRNALILLLPALLLTLSGILHPFLHSHGAGKHIQGQTSLHASSGLQIEEQADPICPLCSGELLSAGAPEFVSSEISRSDACKFPVREFFPHDTTKHLHDPRAPPLL